MASERRPDGSYEYQTIVVSVPRQTGKTTLIRSMGVHRAGVLGRDVHYTAQTGKDARERWADLVKMVTASDVWKSRYKTSLRGGAENIAFHGNAGFHCFAPVKDCLHGSTPATVVLDEAFAHDAAKGEMLMGAISPAQQTLLARQVWIVSTAGTAESTFLHNWIDKAMCRPPRVALFLWAADDDTNPYTLEGIETYHPGVGFQLGEKVLTAADVLGEVENVSRAEYERAFANRRTLTSSNLIPADVWQSLGPDEGLTLAAPDIRQAVITYDVAADRSAAAIVASWRDPVSGKIAGKIVRAHAGTSWLAPAVNTIRAEWRPSMIRAVGHGPVLDVTAALRDLGLEVDELNEREFATASGAFLTGISDADMTHDGNDTLAESVTGLVTRAATTDGIAFSRRHSVGDSSAAIALVAGTWTIRRDATTRKPSWSFAS